MQKLLLAAMLLGTSAMAAPIFCGGGKGYYRLAVSNDHRAATLTIRGKVPTFGHLVCRRDKQFVCRTQGVADAGYQATFTRHVLGLQVQIEEQSFSGSVHLAQLTCIEAMN